MFNPKEIKIADIKARAEQAGVEFKPQQFMGIVMKGEINTCSDEMFFIITGKQRPLNS